MQYVIVVRDQDTFFNKLFQFITRFSQNKFMEYIINK